jgi:hypothetical protein
VSALLEAVGLATMADVVSKLGPIVAQLDDRTAVDSVIVVNAEGVTREDRSKLFAFYCETGPSELAAKLMQRPKRGWVWLLVDGEGGCKLGQHNLDKMRALLAAEIPPEVA